MGLPDSLVGKTVAFLGGSGHFGRSLGGRLARAGIPVVLGSRSQERADAAAAAVAVRSGGSVSGALNAEAAAQADIAIIAVPWAGHAEVLQPLHQVLKGRVVIDVVNPLAFDQHGAYPLHVWEGSAAQQAAALLSESTVVGAFHTVAAELLDSEEPVDSDVLVLGDEAGAVDLVRDLVAVVPGLRGIAAGGLRNSQQVESLVASIIAINQAHGIHAGIRITGL